MSNYVTGFVTKDGIKKYDYNALANLPESGTDITNTVISPNADYAEVGEWADENPNNENRLGYFVAIAEVGDNTIKIRKAKSTDDVRGVSVYNPAFSGNASKDKYGEDGELLSKYNYIGVMGIVEIIDNGKCFVGSRCMPADDGTAVPSTNNMGYAVLERIDGKHVLIAVEPGADMIQRVKTDIDNIQNTGGGSGLTEEQLAMFKLLSDWYDEQHYSKMTGTLSMSPSTTTYEIGTTVDVTFSWTFSKLPIEVEFNSASYPAAQLGSAKVTVEGSSPSTKTYTLYGKYQEGETVTASRSLYFQNKRYYGAAAEPTTTNSDFIKSLTGEFATSREKSFLATCDKGKYIWYAYPKRFGTARMGMGSFQGGFESPRTVSVTNSKGYTEDYYVYRSTESGIGTLEIWSK